MAIVPSSTTLANLSSIVLGYVTTNAGDIFNKDKILKWAKDKPVSRNAVGTLTAGNKRASRISEGYVWGNFAVATNYANLHTRNWSYGDYPTGGISSSPYRVADFIGYDNAAKPTLTGSSREITAGEVGYNSVNPIGCALDWSNYNNNTTGVDPTTAIDNTSISNLYLCVAVDGYCTAMLNGMAGDTVAPIGNKSTEFTAPKIDNNDLKKDATRNVTFFLTTDVSGMNGTWANLANVTRPYAVTIPELVGKSIKFSSSAGTSGFGTWSITGVLLSRDGKTFSINTQASVAPTETKSYRVSIFITNVGTSTSSDKSINAGTTMANFEVASKIASSGTYNYTAYLYGVTASGTTTLASKTGSITYTAS